MAAKRCLSQARQRAQPSREQPHVAKAADKAPKRPKSRSHAAGREEVGAIEQRLHVQGFHRIAGVDEAGRGPLAGPVVAAACTIPAGLQIDGVTACVLDSKTLNEAARERIFEVLTAHPEVHCGIAVVGPSHVDSMNILQATLRAMEEAVGELPPPAADAVLVDGTQVPPGIVAEGRHTQAVVKGDSRCVCIGAASILAKVTRDRLMVEADAKWPVYGFKQHKGYPTKQHIAAVKAHGPCPIHRLTFRPLPEVVAERAQGKNGRGG